MPVRANRPWTDLPDTFDYKVFTESFDRSWKRRSAGGLRQLEVTGQEVGVEVGFDDQFDRQAMLLGIGHVLGDVALRIDNDCAAGGFVTDQV